MIEPENPGSNPTWMSTTAAKDRDDYIVTGNKWFSSGADGAAFGIVMAITDPHAEKYPAGHGSSRSTPSAAQEPTPPTARPSGLHLLVNG